MDLGLDETSYIAGRIHGLIEAEVAAYQQEWESALRGGTLPANRTLALTVTLRDLPLPPERLARLRTHIRRFAIQQLGNRIPGGGAGLSGQSRSLFHGACIGKRYPRRADLWYCWREKLRVHGCQLFRQLTAHTAPYERITLCKANCV